MNDPSKAISFNTASLLTLKAELLRKKYEVNVAKAVQVSANEFQPSKSSSETTRGNDSDFKEVSRNEDAKIYETEDHALLEKSRRVLEAKSKFYDRMSRSGGSLNSDDNCLVMFNRKRQEEDEVEEDQHVKMRERRRSSDSSTSKESVNDNAHVDERDDDKVEYTDCLGRTRTCLRKDLDEALRRDKQLADSMPERLDQSKANWMIDTKAAELSNSDNDDDDGPGYGPRPTESVFSDALSTMTKHDEQRLNWERKEHENLDKPDIHYQDVFFDEARTHGVGYFAFSTDETERMQQQKELYAVRKVTESEQAKRNALRAHRDEIAANRVFIAKNRIRERNGLPPLTKEEYEKEQKSKKAAIEAAAAERNRGKLEHEEETKLKKAAEDAERAEFRKEYVRDWDKDKPGVPKKPEHETAEPAWKYKPERLPMSQEEWNEKQRAVRQPEFAPTPEIELKRTNFNSMPPPPCFLPSSTQKFDTFHSTKREKRFQRRNYEGTNNEIDNEESVDDGTTSHNHGAAIPPPVSLNDNSSAAKRAKSQAELEQSIDAGLKYLRDCCDKGVYGNKATWTAKADY